MFGHLKHNDVPSAVTLKYSPSAHTVYVFCVDLRTNSDYFSIQH